MFKIKPRHQSLIFCFVLLLPFRCLAAQDSKHSLTFGFLPSRSAISLFKHYAPLRSYLMQQLNTPLVLETTVDYPTFLADTKKRKYDFALTAPHFALLAIDSGHYEAPVTYIRSLMADILVRDSSRVQDIQQLAGKRISIPPQSAIISMLGRHYLQQQGLTGANSPNYVVSPSHNASIHAMLAGDTTAAIASTNITRQFLKKGAAIRRLAHTKAIPGMAFLVARDLPKQIRVSFTRALIQMHRTHAGKAALDKMGYPGYRKTRVNEFEAVRPYLNMYNGSSKLNRD